jgi:hypothetical protein
MELDKATKEKIVDFVDKKGKAYAIGIGLLFIVGVMFYVAFQTEAIGTHYNDKGERDTLEDLLKEIE